MPLWRRRGADQPVSGTDAGEGAPETGRPDPEAGGSGVAAQPVAATAVQPPAATATASQATAAALDAGLERTRGGFMSRLRGFLGTGTLEASSWADVEETLIAGDVGATLAIEVVERAQRRREPGGPEAAVRAELAALLLPRDPG